MELINQLPAFSLVFVRILSMFMIVPFFSGNQVPVPFRIGTAFFLAIIAYGGLNLENQFIPLGGEYIFYVVKEVLIGLMMGFLASMFFAALQVAGQFIDVQMGFFLANVIDPQTGAQVPIIGFLKYYLGILIFLSLDIHHVIINAYIESFQIIPVGHLFLDGRYAEFVTSAFISMFIIAVKISAPVAFCLLLTNVALGITARTVPQMNVFVIGMPIKIALGLLLIYLSLPTFLFMLDLLFVEMAESIYIMINIIANSRP
ncbi:flagellar biosynthetic protein FliR [Desulfuribacillus alkaliarsenatis]|uniref:Flagellar biosynthetic protein FliR n=1 Tax=Desulfuribacillus alkaliarsenatis TaxID=766136 RepID=A0A1E5G623_9FIRM|nr:flagellar biosynthetic protein FliR [Desulfuribacillus alkaliarsenatis]OEF98621.1 flagellar biosynthetic protein FliR [Desulfuribacillus alkaliarsenatis]